MSLVLRFSRIEDSGLRKSRGGGTVCAGVREGWVMRMLGGFAREVGKKFLRECVTLFVGREGGGFWIYIIRCFL